MSNNAASKSKLIGVAALVVVMIAVFLLGVFGASIMERRQESKIRPPLKQIAQLETDNKIWGENYPYEYSSYLEMREAESKTLYGGAFPRDYLDETPSNCILFAGYGFSKDYLQARGHVYAVEDVKKTKRINQKSPATCLACKSPDVVKLMDEMTAESYYASSFDGLKDRVTHPIGCLDCHEPNTMRLRISRPALTEALERQGRKVEEISHQEMRTLVCAQCHVEYYFKGTGNYLTFPWDGGTAIEEIDQYYQQAGFTDFSNAISKTEIVKQQHPDYEVFKTGVHFYRQVACADCHMPYRTEGGMKFTSHHLQSPLLNVSNSCAVCHRWSETEIKSRVESIDGTQRRNLKH